MADPDSTMTSRARLLAAGKSLFSRLGYEQASTSAIAREAGTSESQLVRYFGGKSGLLEAIFNDSWRGLTEQIEGIVPQSAHGREALTRILNVVMQQFARDHDLAFLFLFEGRRLRGNDVALSRGFLSFHELVHRLIREGQADGSFRTDLSVEVLASALLGCAEGMIRDRMIAERSGDAAAYDEAQIRTAFQTTIDALGPDR